MTTQEQVKAYRGKLDDLLVLLAAGVLAQWQAAGLPVVLPGVARRTAATVAAARTGRATGAATTTAAAGTLLADRPAASASATAQTISPRGAVTGTDSLLATVPPLIATYQAAAASLAADFYDDVRSEAGIRGSFTADPLTGRDDARQETLVRWATQPLRPANMPAGADLLLDVDDAPVPDLEAALQRLVQATYRQVLTPARDTVRTASDRDTADAHWAREAQPGSCAFCALLATRSLTQYGPAVYHSAELGGGRLHEDADVLPQSSHYHDGCRCIVVPSWPDAPYEPPEHVGPWVDAYYAARDATDYGGIREVLAHMRQTLGSH